LNVSLKSQCHQLQAKEWRQERNNKSLFNWQLQDKSTKEKNKLLYIPAWYVEDKPLKWPHILL
jgi:hypothetical protein